MTAVNWSQKLGHFVTSPLKVGSSSLGRLASREQPWVDAEWFETQSTSSPAGPPSAVGTPHSGYGIYHVTAFRMNSHAPIGYGSVFIAISY